MLVTWKCLNLVLQLLLLQDNFEMRFCLRRLVFTSERVIVGVVIRSVERYDPVKIKPKEDRIHCWSLNQNKPIAADVLFWALWLWLRIFWLRNRFHVSVHLFSNRSQMTSKCGKNKKVAHEAIAFCDLLLSRRTQGSWRTATWNLFVLYNKETTNYHRKSFFISKSFNMTRKPAFAPPSAHLDKHANSHLT